MTITIQNVEEAKETIKTNDIVLFMKGTKDMPGCGFSAHVVQILNKMNVKFIDVDVLNDDNFKEINAKLTSKDPLKFVDNKKIVGWSISLCTKLDDHKYFGHMRLGSIVDCLSLKGYEKSIVCLTAKLLKYKEADLIVSNQSHIFWKNAFKINSFINGPSNYIFALSKIL